MNFLKFAVFAFAGIVISNAASAQILGTFFAAQDGINTFRVDDGLSFSDTQSIGDFWDDVSGQGDPLDPFFADTLAIEGFAGPSGGYQATDASEADIVTTVGGLVAGQEYQVDVVYSFLSDFDSAPAGLAAGLTSGTVAGLDPTSAVDTGLNTNLFVGSNILQEGLGTAIANVDGEIEVFLDGVDGAGTFLVGYNGIAISPVSVPEPTSLALLAGLGGLSLLRRKRN